MSYDAVEKDPTLFLDDLIDDFGCFREGPSSIKHSKTGRYILCNNNLAKRDGIPIEDYVGLTAYDIGKIMDRKRAVTQNAVAVDQKIIDEKVPLAHYNQAILMHNRSVLIEEVFKKPVFGRNNKVVAILAYSHDITQHAHPLYLFNLYASYYPTQEAIRRFLSYKKIDTVFEKLPTREELLILITMRDIKDINAMAKQLNYSISDIKRYQSQLVDKLKVIGLQDVLMFLEWHSEESGCDAIG